MAQAGQLGGPNPKLTTKLEAALRPIDRLSRLVEALLETSRISLGKLDLARTDVDLATVTRSVVARFEDDARASGTSFVLELGTARGHWDRGRIEQAIGSLVSNAVKYGAGTPVVVTVTSEDGRARVAVRDEGSGIAPGSETRIFERFERGVSAESFGGFGIGLFLARKIVEAHGGTIEAAAASGRGTVVTLTVPLHGGTECLRPTACAEL